MSKDDLDSNTDCHFTDIAAAAKSLAAAADTFNSDQTSLILYDNNHEPHSLMLFLRNNPDKIRRLEKFLKREDAREDREEERTARRQQPQNSAPPSENP